METILDISNKLNENIGKNPKLIAAVKSCEHFRFNDFFTKTNVYIIKLIVNDIRKYTSFQILNEADEERLLTAKMEWILMGYLRQIT